MSNRKLSKDEFIRRLQDSRKYAQDDFNNYQKEEHRIKLNLMGEKMVQILDKKYKTELDKEMYNLQMLVDYMNAHRASIPETLTKDEIEEYVEYGKGIDVQIYLP